MSEMRCWTDEEYAEAQKRHDKFLAGVAHPDGGAPPCEECGAAITGGALECPKCGYIQQGGAPPEPSEEAIEAAREASAHTAELGMDDVLMSRRVTLKILRAAYAIDFGRAASRPGPHE
jgi:hypothetical protein